jgi:hypothetical protein
MNDARASAFRQQTAASSIMAWRMAARACAPRARVTAAATAAAAAGPSSGAVAAASRVRAAAGLASARPALGAAVAAPSRSMSFSVGAARVMAAIGEPRALQRASASHFCARASLTRAPSNQPEMSRRTHLALWPAGFRGAPPARSRCLRSADTKEAWARQICQRKVSSARLAQPLPQRLTPLRRRARLALRRVVIRHRRVPRLAQTTTEGRVGTSSLLSAAFSADHEASGPPRPALLTRLQMSREVAPPCLALSDAWPPAKSANYVARRLQSAPFTFFVHNSKPTRATTLAHRGGEPQTPPAS